jgi:hypothetical protein
MPHLELDVKVAAGVGCHDQVVSMIIGNNIREVQNRGDEPES